MFLKCGATILNTLTSQALGETTHKTNQQPVQYNIPGATHSVVLKGVNSSELLTVTKAHIWYDRVPSSQSFDCMNAGILTSNLNNNWMTDLIR